MRQIVSVKLCFFLWIQRFCSWTGLLQDRPAGPAPLHGRFGEVGPPGSSPQGGPGAQLVLHQEQHRLHPAVPVPWRSQRVCGAERPAAAAGGGRGGGRGAVRPTTSPLLPCKWVTQARHLHPRQLAESRRLEKQGGLQI